MEGSFTGVTSELKVEKRERVKEHAGGRVFQVEGRVSAKTLRQEQGWKVSGTARQSVWPNGSGESWRCER